MLRLVLQLTALQVEVAACAIGIEGAEDWHDVGYFIIGDVAVAIVQVGWKRLPVTTLFICAKVAAIAGAEDIPAWKLVEAAEGALGTDPSFLVALEVCAVALPLAVTLQAVGIHRFGFGRSDAAEGAHPPAYLFGGAIPIEDFIILFIRFCYHIHILGADVQFALVDNKQIGMSLVL